MPSAYVPGPVFAVDAPPVEALDAEVLPPVDLLVALVPTLLLPPVPVVFVLVLPALGSVVTAVLPPAPAGVLFEAHAHTSKLPKFPTRATIPLRMRHFLTAATRGRNRTEPRAHLHARPLLTCGAVMREENVSATGRA